MNSEPAEPRIARIAGMVTKSLAPIGMIRGIDGPSLKALLVPV